MSMLLVPLVAFLFSGLTLFSGFGLGTVLMPVIAVFFPVSVAVALTAVVHCLNNFFKLVLLGKFADRKVVLAFGIPALLAAIAGAEVLLRMGEMPAFFVYHWAGREFQVTALKVAIAILMIIFSLLEILPRFKNLQFDRKYLALGGVISGFFGGLSGHQGALRSAFLISCGLSKESFIATGAVIAFWVDVSRILVYIPNLFGGGVAREQLFLLSVTTAAAFGGTSLGNRFLKKVTIHFVQVLVSVTLFVLAVFLALGVI